MTQPRLSIITCANQSNPYLGEAIASLALACRGHDVQRVLVANGGWQPDAVEASGFDLVITTTEMGLGRARNIGVERCATTWVTFFDADDLLGPAYVRETIACTDREEYRLGGRPFFFNTAAMIDEDGQPMGNWSPALGRFPPGLALRLAHPYTGATLVIRTEVLVRMGGYNWSDYAEDYDLTLRLVFDQNGGLTPSINDRAIYRYRQHRNTMSGNLRHKIAGVRAVQLVHLLQHRRWSMAIGVAASTLRLALAWVRT